jgi:hypothetical protein
VFASILLLVTMSYVNEAWLEDGSHMGFVPQVGRPPSGIYVITNVHFLRFATLENSNDVARVAGVYPLRSGSYVSS